MINTASFYNIQTGHYFIGERRKRKIETIIRNMHNLRVLDVGCANGDMGEMLRRQDNYVVGWDISDKAIKKAKEVLDQAELVDVESDILPIEKEMYDLVVLPEVIEHLFNPEDVLAKIIRKYLKTDGTILITTPNFLHWINRFKFLGGKFRYEEKGMFDRSQVHFFTWGTLGDLIQSLGMKVERQSHVFVPSFIEPLAKYRPSIFAYQFVVLAKKK